MQQQLPKVNKYIRFRVITGCLAFRGNRKWEELKYESERGNNLQFITNWVEQLDPLIGTQIVIMDEKYHIQFEEGKFLVFIDRTFYDSVYKTPDIYVEVIGNWTIEELIPFVRGFECAAGEVVGDKQAIMGCVEMPI